jgi:hypothetical protein
MLFRDLTAIQSPALPENNTYPHNWPDGPSLEQRHPHRYHSPSSVPSSYTSSLAASRPTSPEYELYKLLYGQSAPVAPYPDDFSTDMDHSLYVSESHQGSSLATQPSALPLSQHRGAPTNFSWDQAVHKADSIGIDRRDYAHRWSPYPSHETGRARSRPLVPEATPGSRATQSSVSEGKVESFGLLEPGVCANAISEPISGDAVTKIEPYAGLASRISQKGGKQREQPAAGARWEELSDYQKKIIYRMKVFLNHFDWDRNQPKRATAKAELPKLLEAFGYPAIYYDQLKSGLVAPQCVICAKPINPKSANKCGDLIRHIMTHVTGKGRNKAADEKQSKQILHIRDAVLSNSNFHHLLTEGACLICGDRLSRKDSKKRHADAKHGWCLKYLDHDPSRGSAKAWMVNASSDRLEEMVYQEPSCLRHIEEYTGTRHI